MLIQFKRIAFYGLFIGATLAISQFIEPQSVKKYIVIMLYVVSFIVNRRLSEKNGLSTITIDIVVTMYFLFYDLIYYSSLWFIRMLAEPLRLLYLAKNDYVFSSLQLFLFLVLASNVYDNLISSKSLKR